MTDDEVWDLRISGMPCAVRSKIVSRASTTHLLTRDGVTPRVLVRVLRAANPNRDGGRGPRHDGSETWLVTAIDRAAAKGQPGFDGQGRCFCPAADLEPATAADLLVMDEDA